MIDSRDETKAGAHLSEMVELGIERQKFSARVFQALIKELEIHQKVLLSPLRLSLIKNMLN